jgi:hypothetical protein
MIRIATTGVLGRGGKLLSVLFSIKQTIYAKYYRYDEKHKFIHTICALQNLPKKTLGGSTSTKMSLGDPRRLSVVS